MIKLVILITGARKNVEKSIVYDKLDQYLKTYKSNELIIIHGDALGVDSFSSLWSDQYGVAEIKVPAKWIKFGKKAGSIRNELLNIVLYLFKKSGIDVIVEAFPSNESIGTYDCIKRAEKRKFIININK